MRRLHHVACYVNPEELSHLRAEAAKRRLSLSSYVKGCLMGHYESEPPRRQSAPSENPGVEHLLRKVEGRLADLTEAKANDVLRRLAVLVTMLDRFALTMLIHIPEVAKEEKKTAAASGERRYRNWRRAIEELMTAAAVAETGDLDGAGSASPVEEEVNA